MKTSGRTRAQAWKANREASRLQRAEVAQLGVTCGAVTPVKHGDTLAFVGRTESMFLPTVSHRFASVAGEVLAYPLEDPAERMADTAKCGGQPRWIEAFRIPPSDAGDALVGRHVIREGELVLFEGHVYSVNSSALPPGAALAEIDYAEHASLWAQNWMEAKNLIWRVS